MSTAIDRDALRFDHEREQDGKIKHTLRLGADQTYSHSIHAQESEERLELLRRICNEFPGIDRAWVRSELLRIARATKIDLRWNISKKINGTAPSSARLWMNGKAIETYSFNFFNPKQREAGIKFLAPFIAGKSPSKKKLERAELELAKLFRDKLQEVMAEPSDAGRDEFDPHAPEPIHYVAVEGKGMYWRKPMFGGGVKLTKLCNFTARIVANIERTDGVEKTSELQIEASLLDRAPHNFNLKAADLPFINEWSANELGGEAIVEPEDGYARRAAVAIQKTSTNVIRKTLYTHTGWLEVGGIWVYLHAGGIVGPENIELPKIEVALGDAMRRYKLPAPPTDHAYLKLCFQASLRFLQLGAPEITYPLYCGIWRPLFGECGLSHWINGQTQSFKSEMLSLMCRHYAPSMHAKAFVGGWDSTLNYHRDMAFKLKDAPYTLDDFKPGVYKAKEAAELHKIAEKFLRAQANMSERGRCDEHGSGRGAKPPRGAAWVSGEELPNGQSLRARLWITDINRRDISSKILSLCQADARAGMYASLMSGAIRWFANDGRIAPIQQGFAESIDSNRPKAIAALQRMHLNGDDLRRTSDNSLNLALAFEHILTFATANRLLTDGEAATHQDNCWRALATSAEQQAKHQREEDPVSRFFRLVKSALSSGAAFLSAADGSEPGADFNLACGYRKRGGYWEPGRVRIGCWTPECICLDTETSFKIANDVVGANGDGIGVTSPAALGKHLAGKGFLLSAGDEDRHGRRTDRRRIGGELRMVWRIAHDALDIPGREGGVYPARTEPEPEQTLPLEDQSFDFGPESGGSR